MVLMASRTNSSSEAVFTDGEFSPVSLNFSVHSQDMTFDPDCHGNNGGSQCQYEDYSHIQYPPTRRMTSSSIVPPEPPLRTSSVSSFMSDYSPRSYVNSHTGTLPNQNLHQYYKPISQHQQSNQYLNHQHHNNNPANHHQHPGLSVRHQSRRKTWTDRKSTRLNSVTPISRMPSSA